MTIRNINTNITNKRKTLITNTKTHHTKSLIIPESDDEKRDATVDRSMTASLHVCCCWIYRGDRPIWDGWIDG